MVARMLRRRGVGASRTPATSRGRASSRATASEVAVRSRCGQLSAERSTDRGHDQADVDHRHGYGIMKQVELESHGKVKMGPGTLYGSVGRMMEAGLIRESDKRVDPAMDDETSHRRRLGDESAPPAPAEHGPHGHNASPCTEAVGWTSASRWRCWGS